MTRVYITGSSILLGGLVDVSEVWRAQLQGTPLQSKILTEEYSKEALGCSDEEFSVLSEHQIMALLVAETAWKNAGLSINRKPLKGLSSSNIDQSFGCVSGTSLGGLMAMTSEISQNSWSPTPYSMSRWRGNAIGSVVSQRYGLGGCNLSINAASATGAQALFIAGSLIRAGIITRAVVVAADATVQGCVNEAQEATGAVTKNDAPPLDRNRTGMRPVAGAACVILESEERVIGRQAHPMAEWIGGVSVSEAYHSRAVDPDAKMLRYALDKLIAETCENGDPRVIDWVSLHATGTRVFDLIEINAIKTCLRDHHPWLSAMKRVNGHSLSASGLIDAVLVTHGLSHGEMPPWPSNTDPELDLDSVKPLTPHVPENAILIAQGMGGVICLNYLAKPKKN